MTRIDFTKLSVYCGGLRHKAMLPSFHNCSRRYIHLAESSPASLLRRSELIGLANSGPVFSARASDVEIIQSPRGFYSALKAGIQGAQHRVVLASLYLGTGPEEKELVKELNKAANRGVNVSILLDGLRGTRGQSSSSTLLAPLVAAHPHNTVVNMYCTPLLQRPWRALPARVNEVLGLQHIKIYLFDDSVMLSGANLSSWYFRERQDRYMIFHNNRPLADYLGQLVHTVARHSPTLQSNATLTPPLSVPDPAKDPESHKQQMGEEVNQLLAQGIRDYPIPADNGNDTLVIPLVQMGVYGVHRDMHAVLSLLQGAPSSSRLAIAAGYLNFPPAYQLALLASKAHVDVLTACPKANGFYTADGVSRYIPDAYSEVERQFVDRIQRQGQSHRIHMHEYIRTDWTFHAKGLWYFLPRQSMPSCTLIGSPNFGMRSAQRDLETQVAMVTTNTTLRNILTKEHQSLYNHSVLVDKATFSQSHRLPPWWLPSIIPAIKAFL